MNLLVIDFVNSQWYNNHESFEPLRNPEWIHMLFDLWNIPNKTPISDAKMKDLVELRDWLFTVIESLHKNKTIAEADINKINTYLNKTKLSLNLQQNNSQFKVIEHPNKENWDWVINSILLSFTKLLTQYDLERIKICENPKCKLVFYDKSKSRTKRFCNTNCANVVKVRRHRAKNT